MAIPDPATTDWVPVWNPQSAGPVGPPGPQGPQGIQGIPGNAVPHHVTHETGGTDAITNIDATIIQTGTLNDARLSANVALENVANIFGPIQNFTNYTQHNAGAYFPTDSSNALLLDRYEEGFWTPIFSGDAGASSGTTYSIQIGHYIRTGRVVYCIYYLAMTGLGTGGSGNLAIIGLPFFGNGGGILNAATVGFFSGLNGAVYALYSYMPANSVHLLFPFKNNISSGIDGYLSYSNISANASFVGSVTYLAL